MGAVVEIVSKNRVPVQRRRAMVRGTESVIVFQW